MDPLVEPEVQYQPWGYYHAEGLFATILGRMWPKCQWTGPEEPGAPSPFAWLDAGTLLRGTTNNGKAIMI